MNRRQSFIAGFRTKRPRVLLAGLLLALLVPPGTELALRRFAFSRLPEPTFLIWTHDLWSYIPHRLGVLRRGPERERVFLLGSSALYHSFYGDEGLEATLRALGAGDLQAVTLHTPTQGVLESAQIVDNLPPGKGLVLLSTTPMRLRPVEDSEQAREGHLMLASPSVAGLLEDKNRPAWRYRFALPAFVNYLRLYLSLNRRYLLEGRLPRWKSFPEKERAELAQKLRGLPAPELSHWPKEPEISRERMAKHWSNHASEYREPFEWLALAIQTARAKGYRVALLETPMNPSHVETFAPKVAVLNRLTRRLAETEGVEYLDFTWRIGLGPRDFLDEVHLRYDRPGMSRYHHALAREIRRLLRPRETFLSMEGHR